MSAAAPENGNHQVIGMERTDKNKETRIDELEARLAQQDHSIVELSDEVYQQQKQIANLEIMVRHLAERLQQLEPEQSQSGGSEDEIPPHY
jgi:uncharacterized coiled-coil protein SlyX